MLETQAVVVRIEDGVTYVQTERPSGCGHCSSEGGCASGTLTKIFGAGRTAFVAANGVDARVGESVIIGVEEGALLSSTVAVYLVPLALLIAGAGLGTALSHRAGNPDLYSVLGAAAGLLLGTVWIRIFSATRRTGSRYRPIILGRASEGMQCTPRGCGH
ncbi:MAG: SoxR reducing system RseC family protein [Betaproteobacteria bacterium]|nr:SoxR reducing system RseC family protein [Betaproteobacteria bacterium]